MNLNKIETFNGEKSITDPTENDNDKIYGIKFNKTKVDKMMLEGNLEYSIEDKEILVDTDKGTVSVEFNPDRFRPAEVPILLSNTKKYRSLVQKQIINWMI